MTGYTRLHGGAWQQQGTPILTISVISLLMLWNIIILNGKYKLFSKYKR